MYLVSAMCPRRVCCRLAASLASPGRRRCRRRGRGERGRTGPPLQTQDPRDVPSARRRCRRDNGADRGRDAAAATAAVSTSLLSSSHAGVRGDERANNAPCASTTRSRCPRLQQQRHSRQTRGVSARFDERAGSTMTATATTPSSRTRQRISNRPRGLSRPGSPALLRPSSS